MLCSDRTRGGHPSGDLWAVRLWPEAKRNVRNFARWLCKCSSSWGCLHHGQRKTLRVRCQVSAPGTVTGPVPRGLPSSARWLSAWLALELPGVFPAGRPGPSTNQLNQGLGSGDWAAVLILPRGSDVQPRLRTKTGASSSEPFTPSSLEGWADSDQAAVLSASPRGTGSVWGAGRLFCHWRKLVGATGQLPVPSLGIDPPLNWFSVPWPIDGITETQAPGRGGLAQLCSTHLFVNLPGDLGRVLP